MATSFLQVSRALFLGICLFLLSTYSVEAWIDRFFPCWAATKSSRHRQWRVPPMPTCSTIFLSTSRIETPLAASKSHHRTTSRTTRLYYHEEEWVFDEDVASSETASSSTETPLRERRLLKLKDEKNAHIISRTVPITQDWNLTVWEWEKTSAVVETYWQVEKEGLSINSSQRKMLDPFGLVTWPGSVVAILELLQDPTVVRNKTVLILGAGVGLEAQAVAHLGAAQVIASDIHPTTLRLLDYGAKEANLTIHTRVIDITSQQPLPKCDVMIVADVLYNEYLASHVIRRTVEAYQTNATILISDSQRFVASFESDLNNKLKEADPKRKRVAWLSRWLPSFTGSGVLIDDDQTYDVKARVMWVGPKSNR